MPGSSPGMTVGKVPFKLTHHFFLIYSHCISRNWECLMDVAKVFWSGRSQAVRLPKTFRFDTDQVRIRRHGSAGRS